jgi:hypothetical protein
MNPEKIQECIDACITCAIECDRCATACLNEKDISMLARCIELDRECAEACYATARLMGIGGEHATLFCHVCAEICETCAEECEKHVAHGMEHCRSCAEACRSCADTCRSLTGVNA